jgi:hypothetical protein
MKIDAVLVINLSATLFLTGLAWFLQVVHLPMLLRADKRGFALYAKTQRVRNTALMAGPMLIELITAIWLAVDTPHGLSRENLILAAALVAIIWLETFAFIVPLNSRLIQGFDEAAIRALIRRNWIRTIFWTVRSALMIRIAT